jgi:hypothetical protein
MKDLRVFVGADKAKAMEEILRARPMIAVGVCSDPITAALHLDDGGDAALEAQYSSPEIIARGQRQPAPGSGSRCKLEGEAEAEAEAESESESNQNQNQNQNPNTRKSA